MTIGPGLLLAGCGCLIMTAVAGLMLNNPNDDKLKRRLASVKTSQEKSTGEKVTLFESRLDAKGQYVARITKLLGFDLNKQDHYPMQWWMVELIAFMIACGLAWLMSSLVSNLLNFLLPIAFVVISRGIFGFFTGRRKDKLFRQFPDALAMIVRSVRVGIPVAEAIRAVSREAPLPTSPEFFRLAEEISIGVPLDEALHIMAERNDMAEYRFFATALSLQAQTGGALSETLENLADVIRKRVALRERGHALASEAKTSATVLGCLPIAAALGLYLLNPDYITLLFTEKTGHYLLGGIAFLLGMGVFTMRQIIRKSLQ